MAIAAEITLEGTGCAIALPAYVSLQNIHVVQMRDTNTGRVYWAARAHVNSYASRDAKVAGMRPVETSAIEAEIPAGETNIFGVLYTALKQVPRFANAQDV